MESNEPTTTTEPPVNQGGGTKNAPELPPYDSLDFPIASDPPANQGAGTDS